MPDLLMNKSQDVYHKFRARLVLFNQCMQIIPFECDEKMWKKLHKKSGADAICCLTAYGIAILRRKPPSDRYGHSFLPYFTIVSVHMDKNRNEQFMLELAKSGRTVLIGFKATSNDSMRSNELIRQACSQHPKMLSSISKFGNLTIKGKSNKKWKFALNFSSNETASDLPMIEGSINSLQTQVSSQMQYSYTNQSNSNNQIIDKSRRINNNENFPTLLESYVSELDADKEHTLGKRVDKDSVEKYVPWTACLDNETSSRLENSDAQGNLQDLRSDSRTSALSQFDSGNEQTKGSYVKQCMNYSSIHLQPNHSNNADETPIHGVIQLKRIQHVTQSVKRTSPELRINYYRTVAGKMVDAVDHADGRDKEANNYLFIETNKFKGNTINNEGSVLMFCKQL